jgi:hypothetical protein
VNGKRLPNHPGDLTTGLTGLAQVSRRLHDEPLDALRRQASEKRQGTKSRSGWGGLAVARYDPKLPTSQFRDWFAIAGVSRHGADVAKPT